MVRSGLGVVVVGVSRKSVKSIVDDKSINGTGNTAIINIFGRLSC